MTENTLNLSFETLLSAIAKLDPSDKQKLWEYLDTELFADEDDLFDEVDDQTIADIAIARAEYAAGDYLTYEEYLDQRRGAST